MRGTVREMTQKTVLWLFVLTFAITWGLGMLYVMMPQMKQLFGPMSYTSPIFILMVWAPALADDRVLSVSLAIEAALAGSRGEA